jgi:hypothetical protein
MGEWHSCDQGGLCRVKSRGGGGRPRKRLRISAEEIGERLQSFGDGREESSIKIDETQKLLKLLDVPRRRKILNG